MKSGSLERFIFDRIKADYTKGIFRFTYVSIHKGVTSRFEEVITTSPISANSESPEYYHRIRNVLECLSILLGISYWKLYCQVDIQTPYINLCEDQAKFWETVYTKGLGEFFYKNNIDYRGLVRFPYVKGKIKPIGLYRTGQSSLVLFGGGKDSIVTGELLKKFKKDFTLLSVGEYSLHKKAAAVMNKSLITVKREIDPMLFFLVSQQDAYNGHVPMTAIYSCIGLLVAALRGDRYVISSCEESSSYGNVEYLGDEVNHQWSKSYEFETLLQNYIQTYISGDLTYFSMLRPLKEIAIMKIFAEYPQYFPVFSSCNRNFRLRRDDSTTLWCGECAKCAFVSLLIASCLNRSSVSRIMGKDMIMDAEFIPMFEEILGIRNFKPFECIGTPAESQWAFSKIITKGEYNDSVVLSNIQSGIDFTQMQNKTDELFHTSETHSIPEYFEDIVKTL